jgi:4-hydroxy-tetrahydrodipicolinate synthase
MKFRSDPAGIRGSIAPLVTPFTASGDVDHDGLRTLVRWQLANGTHGISIGGSTGEPSAQSIDERADAIRAVAAEIDDRVPFLPGTGSAKLDETLELTAAAHDAGADAALVITPYYARPTQEALYVWYATVAREFPGLPIVAYNVPSRTAVEIAPETVGRLFRDHDNFVGVKETTKDFEHFSRVLHAAGPDLLVWSGIELLCLPVISLGGAGFVSALTNIAPAAVAEMYQAAVRGDAARAREIHYGVHPLVDLIFTETNPAPAKWLMRQRGLLTSDHVRPPLVGLTDTGQHKVRTLAAAGEHYLTPVDLAAVGCDEPAAGSELPAAGPEATTASRNFA